MVEKVGKREEKFIRRPEELVYRGVYAPVDVRKMLETAETRGRIRRVPVPHLFFGLKQLDDEEISRLLPHVTEKQWAGILDLDLWSRDRMSTGGFLYWEKYITSAQDAVARKLIRAADPELWELTFKRQMKAYAKVEEDEYEAEPEEGEWLETPDKNYLILLPENPDKARLLRALILRLYDLEPSYAPLLIDSSRARTSIEMEEIAYQNRKRRVEEMGFQDYFDAVQIYTFLPPQESLSEKKWEQIRQVGTLPVRLPGQAKGSLLLFQALALITRPQESQTLLEELFFVCNKVLSADCASPADPVRVKRGIRKAITGMNLGLDWWAKGNLQKAAEGVRHHYLQSFFQVGHSRLIELCREAQKLKNASYQPDPGSLLDAVFEGLLERYPLLAEQRRGKIRKRFFRSRQDLDIARRYLDQITKAQVEN
ncbi:DUF6178 family protein [Acidobacteria bacterium AH-259-L09]|nr:DUF6178 family protein [Acidobacteria bacterium AH-259-L09]